MKLSRATTVLLCVSALLIMAGLVHGEQPNEVDDAAQRNLLATSAISEADRHRHHHHHHNDYYHGYSSHRHYGRWHRMLVALKLKALDSETVPSDGTANAPAQLMNTQQTAESPDQEILENEESEKVEEIPTPEDIPTEGSRKLLKTNHGGYGNGWGYGHRHHDDYHGHGGYHHHDDHHHHGGHRSWRHWG